MNNKQYEQYALLDAQIKDLTNQKDELKVRLIQEMIEAGAEKLDTPFGKFSITKLKSWTYPDYVVELGESYKAEKAKAESTGDAEYTETESLRFTSAKY